MHHAEDPWVIAWRHNKGVIHTAVCGWYIYVSAVAEKTLLLKVSDPYERQQSTAAVSACCKPDAKFHVCVECRVPSAGCRVLYMRATWNIRYVL